MKMSLKAKILLLSAVLVLGAGVMILSLYTSKYGLSVSSYSLPLPGEGEPIRVVHLSDLHNSEFGEGNAKLVERVLEQQPDLVVMTGDMLNQEDPSVDTAVNLVRKLSAAVPVYFSYGNHETYHEAHFGVDLTELFQEAGATVLDENWVDVDINGHPLRLGGIYGYCLPAKYLATGEAWQHECDYLSAFQDTDRYTILLCHMPVCWLINGSLDAWEVDCVFAGHAHGGQVRIPFVGGLHAPDQGWFPGREEGIYPSQDGEKSLVLSRGLGSSGKIPRFNNLPHIVVVDFV